MRHSEPQDSTSLGHRLGRLVARSARRLFLRPCYRAYAASAGLRHRYWNRRANDIDAQWGQNHSDFPVLKRIITEIRPRRLLDFGCGSGRLFPLYHQCGVPSVVGQDLSERALAICRQRWQFPNVELTASPIEALASIAGLFDLIICNRVLQHLPPNEVAATIAVLTRIGRAVYVNEMSQSDYSPRFFFMMLHDYERIFGNFGFTERTSGMIGNQRWYVFRPPETPPSTSHLTGQLRTEEP